MRQEQSHRQDLNQPFSRMSVNNDYPTFYYRDFCSNYLMIDPYLAVRRCDPNALPLPGVRCQRGGPEADQGFRSGVGVALRTSIRPPTHTSGQGMITNNK